MMLTYLIDRRNKATTPWTAERDALLTRLWAEGYSASQIADRIADIRVSRCAVIARAHRLKLPGRRARQPPKPRPKPRKLYSPQARPPLPPAIPSAPPAAPMRRLSLLELTARSCRYPLGAWDEKAELFCAATTLNGQVYCKYHCDIAYA